MRRIVAIAMALGTITACDSNSPSEFGNVQVSFATEQAGAPAPIPLAAFRDDTITSGSDTLILTRVEIVLREVELKRVEVANCDDDIDDPCEEFVFGPILVSLPLDGSVSTQLEVDIPPGSYDEIEFDVHKPDDDDPADLQFLQENPTFVDVSIRAEGIFKSGGDEDTYVFETDLSADQELELFPPLVIDENTGTTNITIIIDLDSWFRDPSGALINPDTANEGEPNESLVEENIKDSLEAFEDRDRDGQR